ncbi:MAG: hypothetical protein JW864_05290 [Spirochaetes bacterium]|nr:hypothetical protein [Spirochaetota bacterium]
MSKEKERFNLGRRDFIKTSALAVLGSALPFTRLHAKESDLNSKQISSAQYRKNKYKMLYLTGSQPQYDKLLLSIQADKEIKFEISAAQVNYKNPQHIMDSIKRKECGLILLSLPSLTFSFGRLAQSLGEINIPILIYSPNKDLMMIDANFAAELRAKGASVKFSCIQSEVIEMLRMNSAPGILEGKKALVFGKPFESYSVPAHNLTHEDVYEKTGLDIQYRPLEDLKSLLENVSSKDAEEEMKRWKKEAYKVDKISDKILTDECRMYILMRSLIEKEKLDAVSIDCLSFSFTPNPILPLPCLAFARLRDEGMTASCEADVCGLISSLVFEKLSGRPSFFANVASVDKERSTAVLRHCVSPLKMLGADQPHLPYSLFDYHGMGTALVPKVDFPVGAEITMGAITKDLENFVIWPGKICKGKDDVTQPFAPNYHVHKFCSNRAEIVIKDMDRFFQNIAGIHHIMVIGNYVKKISDAMSAENFKIIGPLDSAIS